MPGPRAVTASTGRKAIRNKLAGATPPGVALKGTGKIYKGTTPGSFKAGSGKGFGYVGSLMGGRSR